MSSFSGGGGVFGKKLLHVREEQAGGVEGGASVTGWNTRILNTVKSDEIQGAVLVSNQVDLPAGDYYVEAKLPCYGGAYAVGAIYNVTAAALILWGNCNHSINSENFVSGRFTIAASAVIELRQHFNASQATYGLGIASIGMGGNEIYSDLKLWKVG